MAKLQARLEASAALAAAVGGKDMEARQHDSVGEFECMSPFFRLGSTSFTEFQYLG